MKSLSRIRNSEETLKVAGQVVNDLKFKVSYAKSENGCTEIGISYFLGDNVDIPVKPYITITAKRVVAKITDYRFEIALADAILVNPEVQVGDNLDLPQNKQYQIKLNDTITVDEMKEQTGEQWEDDDIIAEIFRSYKVTVG